MQGPWPSRYGTAFLKALDVEAIRKAHPYVIVDYANAPTAQVLGPLLTRLNCHVVALNASVDPGKMSIPHEEFQRSLQQLSKVAGVLETMLGVRLDVGGERVFAVDDRGELVPGTTLCAVLAALSLRAKGGGTIAVPVSLPNTLDKIAARYDGHVVRTKVNPQALMEAANRPGVIMAGDAGGSFIWPDFQPVIDGLMTVTKLIEFLVTQNISFTQALALVPPYYVAQGEVDCPWETKGTVMRLLNQQYKDRLGEQDRWSEDQLLRRGVGAPATGCRPAGLFGPHTSEVAGPGPGHGGQVRTHRGELATLGASRI